MDLELQGKVAIVTGGSGGIGKAVATELAREGTDVAIVARRREPLEAAARAIADETGRTILPVVADTTSTESVQAMVRQVVERFGRVDILINGAARPGGPTAPLSETTDDMFWEDMNVKVLGYLRCAREVAPYMAKQGWGRIINISGLAARSSGSMIGGMRNVAVVTMTKNLADELGPKGINVTVVHPGRIATESIRQSFAAQAEQQGVSAREIEERFAAMTSVRKIIEPEEIAYIVTFLASPKSIAINGDVIAAGGGAGRSIYY